LNWDRKLEKFGAERPLQMEKHLPASSCPGFIMGARMFDAAIAMIQASSPPGLSSTERKRQLFVRIYGAQIVTPNAIR